MTSPVALHSTLLKRLIEVGALDPDDSTEPDALARVIRGDLLEGVVCCRVPLVDGKAKTFAEVYWLVFGVGVDGKQVKERKTRVKA